MRRTDLQPNGLHPFTTARGMGSGLPSARAPSRLAVAEGGEQDGQLAEREVADGPRGHQARPVEALLLDLLGRDASCGTTDVLYLGRSPTPKPGARKVENKGVSGTGN